MLTSMLRRNRLRSMPYGSQAASAAASEQTAAVGARWNRTDHRSIQGFVEAGPGHTELFQDDPNSSRNLSPCTSNCKPQPSLQELPHIHANALHTTRAIQLLQEDYKRTEDCTKAISGRAATATTAGPWLNKQHSVQEELGIEMNCMPDLLPAKTPKKRRAARSGIIWLGCASPQNHSSGFQDSPKL